MNDFREYKLLIERTLSFSKTLENDTASIFFRRKALGFLEQGIILSNFKWRYLIKEMMMLNKEFNIHLSLKRMMFCIAKRINNKYK